MRAGRILDSGPPAELVDRHGRRATIRFGVADELASLLLIEEIRGLPGVAAVERDSGFVTVWGDRKAIAHVGAALVRAGEVPADLRVEIPDLEEALVELLETADAAISGPADNPLARRQAETSTQDDVIGAIR
jgi:ABC-2 type transport system ATP-binding protein